MTKKDRAVRRAVQRASINVIADKHEILRCVVGSGVHGVAIEGTDDRDEMGVFIEPPEHVLGLSSRLDTATHRTQPEGVRSGPGDLDLVRHSLRKYMSLATKGNPNLLILLFAPPKFIEIESLLGYELREQAPLIVSKRAVRQTLGYLNGQLKRLDEGKGKRFPNRPELIEKYGWDTKYGSHALRLAYQGYELVTTGRLELPMPIGSRDHVLAVKQGRQSKEQTIEDVRYLERQVESCLDRPFIREEPDYMALNDWMIRAHRRHWGM